MRSQRCALVFSRSYTLDQLYAILERIPFAAGHPLLIRRRTGDLIVWPRMDAFNQVQILCRRDGFFCIRSCHPAGPRSFTCSWLRSVFTKSPTAVIDDWTNARCDCEAMAQQVAEQINALGL